MTNAAALLFALQLTQAPTTQLTYNGRQQQINVALPRAEAEVSVDGKLDEPIWRQAALLTGFSQYQPVDGRPAEDSTEVLVWYDSHNIYFGVRAFEAHGAVRASLADRDKIDSEDYVQILLDPFNDRRRAWIFGVNPLGVQADGIRTEGAPGAASGPGAGGRFENVDLNPDFVFASKGRVTDRGYEVEIRVPFKSIRYQSVDPQSWALNVLRNVQHSNYQDSWTPARRANASFLAQSGTLTGLTELRRGLVLDLNPFSTFKATGAPSQAGDWHYQTTPEVGGNARWGVTSNLTLDATANPDFSQVEADVGQVTVNERFALFFPEKRPFFLEGIENFDTPNQLIYMRQIVNPDAGAKLTGKVASTNIAFLSALDDATYSVGGHRPIFNLLRLRSDVGQQSTVGLTYTDRTEAGDFYNRVAALDTRLVFAKLYYLQLQGAASFTQAGSSSLRGPLFEATADRTGRHWGFHYSLKGSDPEFRTHSGFVPRTGVVQPIAFNRITTYGAKGALLESFNTYIITQGTWQYHAFFDGHAPLETNASAQSIFTLRGGWSLNLQPTWSTNAFDEGFYSEYAVAQPRAGGGVDTVAFVVPERLTDVFGLGWGVSTPRWPTFTASVSAGIGSAVAFFEPSRVHQVGGNASFLWRPTERVRVSGSYQYVALNRLRDDSRFSTANIPRLKLEYQLSRPLFVRFVGQYQSQERAALRDPRTGYPVLVRDVSGAYVLSTPTSTNNLRVDWLVSYRPTPGTVVFAGYGSGYRGLEGYSLNGLDRTDDGLFLKVSYLFRL